MEKHHPGIWIGAAVAVAVLVVAVSFPSGKKDAPQPVAPAPTQPSSTPQSLPQTPAPTTPDEPAAPTATIPPPAKPQPPREPDEPPPNPQPPLPPATLANVRQALDDLDFVIRDFRAAHGENPVGDNAEITKALRGDNLKQLKLKLPDNNRINNAGELCDLWGNPYFFHQVSGTKMEIRSAGPDGKMWSADDIQQ